MAEVIADGIAAVLRHSFQVVPSAKELAVLVPLQIMMEDPVVERLMLAVKCRVREDARLQEVVAEVSPIL